MTASRVRGNGPPTAQSSADDLELVGLALSGDESAMAELYRRHHRRLARVCVAQLGGDRVLAGELAHDAMVKSWERLDQFSGDRFDAWVTTIARRLCVDHHRRTLRQQALGREESLAVPDPADTVVDREAARLLRAAVDALPTRQAAAVRVRLAGGTTQAVAEAVGVEPNAADQLLHRARAALRIRLARLRLAAAGLPGARQLQTMRANAGIGSRLSSLAELSAAGALLVCGVAVSMSGPEGHTSPRSPTVVVTSPHEPPTTAPIAFVPPTAALGDVDPSQADVMTTTSTAESGVSTTSGLPPGTIDLGIATWSPGPAGAAYGDRRIDCMPIQIDILGTRAGVEPDDLSAWVLSQPLVAQLLPIQTPVDPSCVPTSDDRAGR